MKQDAETGKTIPYAGAGFKIYDPDGNPVTMTFTYPTPTTIDVFYTNAEGSLVTPEKLPFGKGTLLSRYRLPTAMSSTKHPCTSMSRRIIPQKKAGLR